MATNVMLKVVQPLSIKVAGMLDQLRDTSLNGRFLASHLYETESDTDDDEYQE